MNNQIYEEAANWLVEFRTGDNTTETRKKFNAWIRKSPEHLRAYLEITEIWQDASEVGAAPSLSRERLVEAARTADNVISVPDLPSSRTRPEAARHKERSGIFISLAASVLLAMLAVLLYIQRDTYSTDIGEQRSITLADGSTIELNSQSKVRVRYTDTRRNVELLQGQALFRVAKDTSRPFLVSSSNAQVRAVGTQFDVYRKKAGTTVTVLEGRVAVLPNSLEQKEDSSFSSDEQHFAGTPANLGLVLSAGEQVTLRADAAPQIEKANVSAAIAWRQHQLIFKSSPLSEVVEEFNRYNTRRLIIEGANLSDFNVSGVYSSTDTALLIRFLRDQPGMLVQETDDAIVISRQP